MAGWEGRPDAADPAYRERCAGRSAAEFRFEREACGMAAGEVAARLGIAKRNVERWESASSEKRPSARAWELVDSEYARLVAAVREGVSLALELEGRFPGAAVQVAYRRPGDAPRDGGTVAMANARARALAFSLMALGLDVEPRWAGEGAAGLAASAPPEEPEPQEPEPQEP